MILEDKRDFSGLKISTRGKVNVPGGRTTMKAMIYNILDLVIIP